MPDITTEELRVTAAACRLMGGAHACAAADMERAADTIECQAARIAELTAVNARLDDAEKAADARISELEQQLAAQVKHTEWQHSVIDSVALAAHGWTEETRQAYVPSQLFQAVASLRADAERWRGVKEVFDSMRGRDSVSKMYLLAKAEYAAVSARNREG